MMSYLHQTVQKKKDDEDRVYECVQTWFEGGGERTSVEEDDADEI